MSVIERDYVTARTLIRRAELAGVFDGDDDRHALRDAVKRLHGAAIANTGAVDRIAELESELHDWQARDQGVPTAAESAEMDRLDRRDHGRQ